MGRIIHVSGRPVAPGALYFCPDRLVGSWPRHTHLYKYVGAGTPSVVWTTPDGVDITCLFWDAGTARLYIGCKDNVAGSCALYALNPAGDSVSLVDWWQYSPEVDDSPPTQAAKLGSCYYLAHSGSTSDTSAVTRFNPSTLALDVVATRFESYAIPDWYGGIGVSQGKLIWNTPFHLQWSEDGETWTEFYEETSREKSMDPDGWVEEFTGDMLSVLSEGRVYYGTSRTEWDHAHQVVKQLDGAVVSDSWVGYPILSPDPYYTFGAIRARYNGDGSVAEMVGLASTTTLYTPKLMGNSGGVWSDEVTIPGTPLQHMPAGQAMTLFKDKLYFLVYDRGGNDIVLYRRESAGVITEVWRTSDHFRSLGVVAMAASESTYLAHEV